MNTIIVGDYSKIENTECETDTEYWHNFLFDRFKLVFDLYGHKIKCIVELKDRNHLCVKNYVDLDYPNGYDFTVGYDNVESINLNTGEVKYGKWGYDGITGGDNYNRGIIIDHIMKYIMLCIEKREKATKEIKHRAFSEKTEVKRKNIPKNKKVFLLNEICDYFYLDEKPSGNKTREINCPCWSVRGHYRHYKSGKVIFVKEFEKGKQRGKEKPRDKTYTV